MQNTIFSTLTPCTHYFLLIRSEDVCWPHLTSFPLDQCLDQIYSLCLKVMQQRSVIHLNTLKVFFCFTFFGCKYCVLFCTSFCQLIRIVTENSRTTAKKLKKLKNTITGSFEAKIGRNRTGKIENKNYRSVSLIPGTK